jgi:NAD(P)-dependent dehydrogenase (short-subunit alcohol dehydrogenase family)
MDLQLAGKRAIVTGGSKGIGLATAKALAAEGVDVALVARNSGALASAASSIRASAGVRVLAVSADTSDDDSVRSMVAEVADAFGGIDILVNAAAKAGALGAPPGILNLADDALRDELETKVFGYLRCIRAVAPHMIALGWGRIVNIAGNAALQTGNLIGSIRNVSIVALTKNVADELAASGIGVTSVHPGLTVTERIPAMLTSRAQAGGITEAEVEAALAERVSIGRLVTSAEVAAVITFLVSPTNMAVNGDSVAVNGGVRGVIRY